MLGKKKKIKSFLRMGIVISAVFLIFLLFLSWNYFEVYPGDLAHYFLATLGSAGTSVEVPPNPYNTMAQQLIEREKELDMRESGLEGALIQIEKENRMMLHFISGAMTALFVLLLINFYFDYQVRRVER